VRSAHKGFMRWTRPARPERAASVCGAGARRAARGLAGVVVVNCAEVGRPLVCCPSIGYLILARLLSYSGETWAARPVYALLRRHMPPVAGSARLALRFRILGGTSMTAWNGPFSIVFTT